MEKISREKQIEMFDSATTDEQKTAVKLQYYYSMNGLIKQLSHGDDDLRQEFNLWLWAKLDTFNPHLSALSTFATTILTNRKISLWKIRNRHNVRAAAISTSEKPIQIASKTETIRIEETEELEVALQKLESKIEPRYYKIWKAYHEGTTYAVLSEAEGVSKERIRQLVIRVNEFLAAGGLTGLAGKVGWYDTDLYYSQYFKN